MTKPISISQQAARGIILNAQLLDGASGAGEGADGLRRIFDRLGYVQIDTIHIVERAHHHVLWTRLPGYAAGMLHQLQAVERGVFEYWAHAMAYLPMTDYRYYLYRMANFRNPANSKNNYLAGRNTLPLADVMKRIRAEGALMASDFEHPKRVKSGPWWDWKPAKQALELLFWRGELMIAERRNFQKVYDLTERVLPPGVDTRIPGEIEMARFLVTRALSAMGVADDREINAFLQPAAARDSMFRAASRDAVTRAVDELVEAGKIEAVAFEGGEDRRYFTLRGTAEQTVSLTAATRSVRLLSPFDNLVIQRDRLRRIFDYDYTLECYLPAARRTHGYFAGRVDPKADRKTGTLIVQSVSLEDDFKPSDEFIKKFGRQLAQFASFNQCGRVSIRKTRPAKLKAPLQAALKRELE
jgi:uncharacterized protein YcaQ